MNELTEEKREIRKEIRREKREKLEYLHMLKQMYRTDVYFVDIEIFKKEDVDNNKRIHGKYLVHGFSDLYSVNTIDGVLKVIKEDLEEYEKE